MYLAYYSICPIERHLSQMYYNANGVEKLEVTYLNIICTNNFLHSQLNTVERILYFRICFK